MRTQPRAELHTTCARYGTTPNLGERPCSWKQRRCPLRPKVRPDERLCNNLCASPRQMAAPIDEEARRREPLTGATAIPRVDYVGESHCASPNTSGVFTLPKQCNRPPTMKRSGQLGCLDRGPARQPSRLKGLTAMLQQIYSASSRMSRERTDWRPTCRKSTCRAGFGIEG